MSVVKWMRKNNTKLMAVVVIVLMVAFIGGSSFQYIFRGSGGASAALAYYGPKKKINHYDRMRAGQEIEILMALRADEVLRSQDLRGILLSELLFAQSRGSGPMLDLAKQTIQRNQYRISDEQLRAMSQRNSVPGDIYWILLRDEAEAAGIRIRNEDVGQLLGQIIPRLFDNSSYADVMQSLVRRFNAPENQILSTFGELLAVLQYAQTACSMENVTAAQARHIASRESETLDAEFVQIPASAFVDKQQTPSDEAVAEQFNKYKANFTGDVSEANPYGFGYQLPDRVQLDYLAVKIKDIEAIVKPPTPEETEQYYQQNRQRLFSEQMPTDPNDPNSPRVARAKAYAEVADTILEQLKRQRVTLRAEQILQEAKTIADANLQLTGPEDQQLTVEQRRERAGDYAKIAHDLGAKYNLTLYSGRTGLLNAMNVQTDKHLGRMFLTGFGYTPVRLSQMLFSAKEFGENAAVLLSLAPAEMYRSIGPARDPMAETASSSSDQIMMLARVVDVEKAAPPENLDVAYSLQTLNLGGTPPEQAQTFSVKEEVVKDLRKLAAWDTAKGKAEEFLALAQKDGWDKAVTQFNQLYGEKAKAEPDDPNVFKLDRLNGLQQIQREVLAVLAAQAANNPAGPLIVNEAKVEGRLVEQLNALAPAQRDAPPLTPQIMEFKPNQSFYCLKSLTREHLSREDFQRMKGMVLNREEYNQTQNLAAVHLNPANILKRTGFRWVKEPAQSTEDKTEQKPKEAS
jgi:hypothetical protein